MSRKEYDRTRGIPESVVVDYANWLDESLRLHAMADTDLADLVQLHVSTVRECLRSSRVVGPEMTKFIADVLDVSVPDHVWHHVRKLRGNVTAAQREAMQSFYRGQMKVEPEEVPSPSELVDSIIGELSTLLDHTRTLSVESVVAWMQQTPFSEAERATLTDALWRR